MSKSKKKIIAFSANVVFSNEELLTEILLHLPVKSLVRCKCVSRKWLCLISSPHFTRLRVPCFRPASGIFLYHSSFLTNPYHKFVSFNLENPIPTPLQKFPFLQHDHHNPKIMISQSCNGLLLCHTVHNPFTFDENYYIFNPTTQQFVTLPRPLSGDVIGMSLAFDPWKSSHYKVISLQISKLEPEVQDHEEDDYRIVYFGESYGHLHLIQVNRQNLALYNVYEMKHDGTGWFLKYEVNFEDVVLAFPHIIRGFLETTDFHYYGMAVLDVVRGDKEEDSFLILHIPGMVILRYNLVDKSFYKLWDFDNGVHDAFAWCLHFDRSNTYQYIESTYCW